LLFYGQALSSRVAFEIQDKPDESGAWCCCKSNYATFGTLRELHFWSVTLQIIVKLQSNQSSKDKKLPSSSIS
jgi:hypothetical protein